jgi:methyl-accepting chemotaxis protein
MNTFLNYFRRSIRAKLVATFAVLLVAVVAFILWYYPQEEKNMSMQFAKQQTKMLSDMLGFLSGAALTESNFDLLQSAVSWAKSDSNIRYMAFIGTDDATIYKYPDKKDPHYNPRYEGLNYKEILAQNQVVVKSDDIIVHSPSEYKGAKQGHVILVYSLKNVQAKIASTLTTSVIIGVFILVIGIGFIFFMSGVMTRQLVALRNSTQRVSEGNLDEEIKVTSQDELGQLAESIDKMLQNIRRAIVSEEEKLYLSRSVQTMLDEMDKFADGDLTVQLHVRSDDEISKLYQGFNRAVQNIRQMMEQVTDAVDQTGNASMQIRASTEQLSAGAHKQSAQTNEVAAAVEEMTHTISENANNATKTADVAAGNGALAQKGGEIVQQTVNKMREIASVVSRSTATIERLGTSSAEIGEIVLVIDEIADQTNLLALNAAIEAARAGEQGRGFAVVADEVRKLAERTTKATKQIAGMIKNIQNEAHEAVHAMQEGNREVTQGMSLADGAGQALQEIVASSKAVQDMIYQIAVASEEQSATSSAMAYSVESISQVSGETVEGVGQIAGEAEKLNELTDHLRTLVSQFKVENELSPMSRTAGKRQTSDRYRSQSVVR